MNRGRVGRNARRFAALGVGAFALLTLSSESVAQVTGKVIGTVTDADTGAPLVGAQVVVEGTNLGNVTNADGYYFINNVPVGLETITAQYLGYQTTAQEHRILAGQTMTVDFALSSEIIQADDAIVAVIEREPLVARDNTISKSRFTAEQAQGLPSENLNEVITLGAGIYSFAGNSPTVDGGFIIRGGRGSESATYVDGVLITDFRNQSNSTEIGQFAVEEVDVITGGFNAEFGNAQSGIVNIVTREGGREYHGNVRFTTDGQFGTDGYDLSELGLRFDSTTGLFERVGDPEEEACCGFNAVQASFGGPVVPDKLTFFGSFETEGSADFFPAAAGWNPADAGFNSSGSTQTILPGNKGFRTRAQSKVTAFLTNTSKFTGTYLYSIDQFENYHDLTFTGTHLGLLQILSGEATKTRTHDIILGWDQQIFQTGERNLNLQVRGNWHQTKFNEGTPLNEVVRAILLNDDEFNEELCGESCANAAGISEPFEDDFLNLRPFDEIEFFFEDANPADPTLLNVPTLESPNPDPVFGIPRIFGTTGLDNQFRRRQERRYGLRVDLDSQLNRVHRIKVGGEYTWINFSNAGPLFTSGTFADLYDVDPRVAAVYAQDRLDYGDLVIDVGLRLDHWDPNTMFPLIPGVVPCEISAFDQCTDPADSEFAQVIEAPTRTELSPRLGVAHPITDATQVRLSFGKFHQLPQLERFFDGHTTDFVAAAQNPNILYGNPNLDYVETTAFEAGITHLLSDNVVVDVVGYNRDRRGAIRVDVFQPGDITAGFADERRIAVNGDNGNVKGVDFTVSKRFSNYFSTDLAWSLQWARGTTSSPLEFATAGGLGRNFDPLFPGRLLTPPTEILPETFDRLHNINWQFNLGFPDNFNEGTAWGQVLRNVNLFVVYNAHSGQPFTRRGTTGQGDALEDINSSRLPWFHQGDFRVVKGVPVSEGFDLELFASVQNFLDVKNVIGVNASSGLANASGFEDQLSQSPTIPVTFRTDGSAASAFPVSLDVIDPDFQDEFGQQDLNNDGTITFEEAQTVLREAIRSTGDGADFIAGNNGDSPYNYGEPRQWRFGAEIRF